MRIAPRFPCLFLLAILFLGSYNSYSQDQTAIKSGFWDDPLTWSGSIVPTSANNVIINSGFNVTVRANAASASLTVEGNQNQQTSLLTINENTMLSIGGAFEIIGGNGNRRAGLTNNGTVEFGNTVSLGTTNSIYTIGANSTFVYNGGNQAVPGIPGENYQNLIISGSGIKTYSLTTPTPVKTLTVNSGVNLLLDGTSSLTPESSLINGTVIVQNTASLVKGLGAISFNSGSTYEHGQNGGAIPTATWNVASTSLFTGIINILPDGAGQSFGNFTWNNNGQTADLSFASILASIQGNLSILDTGSGAINLLLSGPDNYTTNLAGNFIQTGGIFRLVGNGGTTFGNLTLNVGGNFTLSGGTFDVHGNTLYGGTGTLNVARNFSMSGTSTFTESGTGTANVNYNGTSTQIFSKPGGTISNTINFAIISGAIVNFGTSVLNGSNGMFRLNSGGSIVTANPQGISNMGSTGSIQITGTRTYNNAANYTYNGTSAQMTGNGLTGANNFSINNSAGLTLSAPTAVSGVLALNNGILTSSSTNTLTVTNNSTNAITGASVTRFVNGPLIRQLATGQTYSFPVGKGSTYLPFGLSGITGTAPRIRVEAFTGNSGGTASVPLALLSTTEFWQSSVISGTYNGGVVSLTRQTALSGLDAIGRNTTQAGSYTSLNGTVTGTSINSSENTGNSLGFFVMAVKYKIYTGTISPSSICQGTSVSIPYSVTGTYNANNIFTAQLSNATGSFAAPINIETLSSTASGTITGTIPIGTAVGEGYRIRVVSTNPEITGVNNGINLTVKAIPTAPTVSNNGPVCVGNTLNVTASPVEGATYNWTGPNGFASTQQSPSLTNAIAAMAGTYTVTATVNGCTSIEASTNVVVTTNITWSGTEDTNWNNTANWSCNSLPTLETDVLIPEDLASNNYPVINAGTNAFAKNLSIENGASVEVNDNWLRIAGVYANAGVLNAENGSVSIEGAAAQTIPVSAFENNRIQNLRIDNTSGVTSEAIIELTGILTVETGNFNTGNSFTLISDTTQTALIDGSGNGQVAGTVKMQRYLDVAFGYKYFSSPFSNSSVGDFSSYMDLVDPVTSFPHFYTYDENREYDADSASTGWKAYTTETDPLGILNGYALNFGSSLTSPKTIEISGNINNGPQEIILYNNHRLYTKGFNLVGNPYPSPIDWNAPGWTKTNIDDAIYFFTAGSNQYTGTYTSLVDGTSSDGRSSSIIPSMQGFFVHVTDDISDPPSKVTATLGVTNPVRTDNSIPQEFLKVREPEKDALIRISAGFENEVKTDPAVIYFPHFAKLSFEKDKDALKLMNTDISVPNLYSLTPENKKLSINGLPVPGSGEIKKIPLGLKTEKDGWMSIGLQDLQNLPSNFNVYLIDSEKRIGQNLSRKPQYRFFAKSGQHESRFHLMFSETEISDPAIAFDAPFSVKTVGGKVMVSMNLETGQKSILLASTVTGQILDRKNVSEKETVEIEGIKSSGIYFFSINLKDGMFSKKVLIQK